jgi:hypothetical protein
MGAALSAFTEIQKGDEQKEKETNDALNSLYTLAHTKTDLFYSQITSSNFDAALIPIDKVVDKRTFIYCEVDKGASDIEKIINDTAGDFASGDAAKGIAKIIQSTLSTLIGQSHASMSEDKVYTIATGDIGGLHRLDILVFCYSYTSNTLMSITKAVKAACVVLSSVKLDTVSENTMRVIVQKTYKDSPKDEKEKIVQQLLKASGHIK